MTMNADLAALQAARHETAKHVEALIEEALETHADICLALDTRSEALRIAGTDFEVRTAAELVDLYTSLVLACSCTYTLTQDTDSVELSVKMPRFSATHFDKHRPHLVGF